MMNEEYENLATTEVALGTLEGLYCLGCEKLIIGNGYPCYCKDELEGILAISHINFRWCTEECLHRTHEEPVFVGPEGVSWSD